MQFAPPRRRRPAESHVAMINVVFLLLVFFVLTARIAPPDPIAVMPPVAGARDSVASAPHGELFLGAEGTLAMGDARGETVLARIMEQGDLHSVTLVADAGVAAGDVAVLLRRLAELNVTEVRLVTRTASDLAKQGGGRK